ncbi:MAG: hypothetical protein HYS07_10940 [Chlamydiae bacterium]|nr:hypothetical protein [Chlamydiota bacterium]MBI3276574.1 hypothetical protein [Chlamydiota bacterium]
MNFEWKTQEEKLKRWMKISPRKKLEWLYEMHQFNLKYDSPFVKRIRKKLKELRNDSVKA